MFCFLFASFKRSFKCERKYIVNIDRFFNLKFLNLRYIKFCKKVKQFTSIIFATSRLICFNVYFFNHNEPVIWSFTYKVIYPFTELSLFHFIVFSAFREQRKTHCFMCTYHEMFIYSKRTIVKFPTKVLFPYQLTHGKFENHSLDPLIDWLIEGLIQLIAWLLDWIVFYAVSAVICNSGQWRGSKDLEMQDYWYKITWNKSFPNKICPEDEASGLLVSGLLRSHCIAFFCKH